MRILLTSTASFVPPRGGSTRANRVWLEELAARGHVCRVVCGTVAVDTAEQVARMRQETESQGFLTDAATGESEVVLPSGIVVSQHKDLTRNPGTLGAAIRKFQPDRVFVSSEDLSHSLLREASEAAPDRVVYLAHTPQFFPFGPESWSPDARATARVRDCASVVVIGHHMAGYVREHLGIEPRVTHPNIYGAGPFESYSNRESGFVLIVNPCAVKGLSIFADVARAMPHISFAALPGWGTTARDREALQAIPNATILKTVRRIEEVLERCAVLLMPSLWYEGFGLIVMEAMARGIPVIASDSGGLVEAKQGTRFVLPVVPIREYLAEFDDVHMPRPVIHPQDREQWIKALQLLMSNREVYEAESERSRERALDFIYGLKAGAMEELLLTVSAKRAVPGRNLAQSLDRLSPKQRALLLARIKDSRAQA